MKDILVIYQSVHHNWIFGIIFYYYYYYYITSKVIFYKYIILFNYIFESYGQVNTFTVWKLWSSKHDRHFIHLPIWSYIIEFLALFFFYHIKSKVIFYKYITLFCYIFYFAFIFYFIIILFLAQLDIWILLSYCLSILCIPFENTNGPNLCAFILLMFWIV